MNKQVSYSLDVTTISNRRCMTRAVEFMYVSMTTLHQHFWVHSDSPGLSMVNHRPYPSRACYHCPQWAHAQIQRTGLSGEVEDVYSWHVSLIDETQSSNPSGPAVSGWPGDIRGDSSGTFQRSNENRTRHHLYIPTRPPKDPTSSDACSPFHCVGPTSIIVLISSARHAV